MLLTTQAIATPLKTNADGVVLVGETRVPLDTVVEVFNQGATAEEIVDRYSSLQLADVYATIAFYLNNQVAVEEYLEERRERAQKTRLFNESRPGAQAIRERLLARHEEKGLS